MVCSGVQGPDDEGSSTLVQVFHLLRGRAPDAFLSRRSLRVPKRSVNSKRARGRSVPWMKKVSRRTVLENQSVKRCVAL